MSRYKGYSTLSKTYDVSYWGPLDTRMLVPLKSDLLLENTWIPKNLTESSAYDGMIVAVAEDTEDNNGIYYLKDYTNLTSESAWIKLATLNQINELRQLIENIEVSGGGISEEQLDERIDQLRSELLSKGFITESEVDAKLAVITPQLETIKDDIDSLKTQVGESHGSVAVKSRADLPNIGSVGIVYIIEDENAAYRWDLDQLKYYSIGRNYEEIQVINGGTADEIIYE